MFDLKGKQVLVTGGTGFIGSALVRGLLARGATVRSLDNDSRGSKSKLGDAAAQVELLTGDICDYAVVSEAVKGVDIVCHLAYINGTEYFYSIPEKVLEVAVKGMTHVCDACREHGVKQLVLASSSEVYQTPPTIPTDESAPLIVPDVMNPRYSYGGGKIICELMAINYGRAYFDRAIIFRPHNVYGPNMGYEHVIPQFAQRMSALFAEMPEDSPVPFPIQGTGEETRSFVFIDDFIEGVLLAVEKGEHLNIYHIGTQDEWTIADLAREVAACFDREISVEPGKLQTGSTNRRCPDISKLSALGYAPRTSLREGLVKTVEWYRSHPKPD